MAVAIGIFLFGGFVELLVAAQLMTTFGFLPVMTTTVLLCATGAWVVKHEGLIAWRNVSEAVANGRTPASELLEGLVVLTAGVLLLLPGFVSAIFGLLLAISPLRRLLMPAIASVVSRRVPRRVRVVGARMSGASFGPGADPRGGGFYAAGQTYSRPNAPRNHDDPERGEVIDLEGEEYFMDEPSGELEQGNDS